MLIDAAHPEQTRVVLVSGNRVEEFDFETATKKQLKGNIYLAKVTRVEPSLQAAFVEYGGNRHGFLAFGEIHPDYYQIPVEDRLALLEEEAAEDEEHDEEDDESDDRPAGAERASEASGTAQRSETGGPMGAGGDEGDLAAGDHETDHEEPSGERSAPALEDSGRAPIELSTLALSADGDNASSDTLRQDGEDTQIGERAAAEIIEIAEPKDSDAAPEAMGAEDALEELPRRRRRPMRRYKIQEVIKRRQILLIQVVKEERGTKGAALTTFLSLAGRYCVLMPNTDRGGGISRKITSGLDRKRLKDIAIDLEVPEGMGLIIRTAGANRTRPELKRDFEYLLRLWESVRELTLKSSAPALVYEEGNLVKRSIRDLYGRDIEAVLVEGDEAYKEAKAFMKMLTPSHAKHVQQYKDKMPLFQRYQVETQLDLLYSPRVDLRSGGYIVLNATEALVAIDVNSGKSTREHSIEETALRTNLEASEEVARQLRLRDLAGLIVIDYIDMEEHRNNRQVERRLKDHLKTDRARIQVGRISAFGLLEMSRQRLRASVLEGSTLICPHCTGAGRVGSVETQTLRILRAIEEEGIRGRMEGAHVKAPADVVLYLLNHKREMLRQIEERFGLPCYIEAGADLKPGQFSIEKEESGLIDWRPAQAAAISPDSAFIEAEPEAEGDDLPEPDADREETVDAEPIEIDAPRAESAERMRDDGEQGSRRRRRRRGGRGRDDRERPRGQERERAVAQPLEASVAAPVIGDAQTELSSERPPASRDEDQVRRRRRGRRGGRRNRRDRQDPGAAMQAGEAGNGAQPSYAPAPDEDAPFTRDEPVREPVAPIAREIEARETPAQVSNGHDEEPRAAPREAAQAEPEPPGSDDPNQPRRKGWWQRRIFGE
jgi:ribonuclease E